MIDVIERLGVGWQNVEGVGVVEESSYKSNFLPWPSKKDEIKCFQTLFLIFNSAVSSSHRIRSFIWPTVFKEIIFTKSILQLRRKFAWTTLLRPICVLTNEPVLTRELRGTKDSAHKGLRQPWSSSVVQLHPHLCGLTHQPVLLIKRWNIDSFCTPWFN